MLEARKNPSLLRKSRRKDVEIPRHIEHLERNGLLELAVRALRKINRSHTTPSKHPYHPVGTETLAGFEGERSGRVVASQCFPQWTAGAPARLQQRLVVFATLQHAIDGPAEVGIAIAGFVEKSFAFVIG
jgi:hypothetical protein